MIIIIIIVIVVIVLVIVIVIVVIIIALICSYPDFSLHQNWIHPPVETANFIRCYFRFLGHVAPALWRVLLSFW